MSGHPPQARGALSALLRLAVLAVAFGAMLAANKITPGYRGPGAPLAALGLLLLGGSLMGQLGEYLRLPHLTGYLAAGILAGPHALGLIDAHTVHDLQIVNTLALTLIAFSAGAELTTDMLKKSLRSLAFGSMMQAVVLFLALAGIFLLCRPLMPFLTGQPVRVVIGLALLWGVVGIVKSPAAVLGVLSEAKAAGPLSSYALGMVVVLDVVVLVLFSITLVIARGLIEPGATISLHELVGVGHEILTSVALGTTLGLLSAVYLFYIGRGLILFLIGVAYGMGEMAQFLGYDSMLIFAVAGFVVQNLSGQGKKLLHAIERSGSIVYVVFFANAGAHLDLGTLRALWPVALLLAVSRGVVTAAAAYGGSRLAKDPPVVQRYGFAPLLSQAGVALGIAVAIEAAFPAIGPGFRSLAIAMIGINEAVGPVIFKFALDRAGETHAAEAGGEDPPVPAGLEG